MLRHYKYRVCLLLSPPLLCSLSLPLNPMSGMVMAKSIKASPTSSKPPIPIARSRSFERLLPWPTVSPHWCLSPSYRPYFTLHSSHCSLGQSTSSNPPFPSCISPSPFTSSPTVSVHQSRCTLVLSMASKDSETTQQTSPQSWKVGCAQTHRPQ
jgi:hypothetical protein